MRASAFMTEEDPGRSCICGMERIVYLRKGKIFQRIVYKCIAKESL